MAVAQFQQRLPFVDDKGRLTKESMQVLNDAFTSQELLIEQLAQVLGLDLPSLAAAAQGAQDAADNANAAAANATNASSLAVSYVDNPTPITVTDAGANVTVTIAAHNRIYGDGTSVAVNGGSITGLPYSTTQYIYYDDAARAGGAVSYQSSTDPLEAAQLNDRHSVGVAPGIPAASLPVDGGGVAPPGGGYYYDQ